ncbi:MAG: type I restriction enzyme HsdR N-terminal domain-containing protein [Bacteroidales bacterium]|nr:type I restriction enzyme HsdR N-terminal domain-containing protein [Bacteroidales bacterium]
MSALNLPPIQAKVIQRNDTRYIFDIIRTKYVTLTPEEWVRQHFVHYLIHHLGYPQGLIANEISIALNNTKKRCDTVVYDKQLNPLILIEYKASDVSITQETFYQIMRYNMKLHVPVLIVSNGMQHYCCRINYSDNKVDFLEKIPDYSDISRS